MGLHRNAGGTRTGSSRQSHPPAPGLPGHRTRLPGFTGGDRQAVTSTLYEVRSGTPSCLLVPSPRVCATATHTHTHTHTQGILTKSQRGLRPIHSHQLQDSGQPVYPLDRSPSLTAKALTGKYQMFPPHDCSKVYSPSPRGHTLWRHRPGHREHSPPAQYRTQASICSSIRKTEGRRMKNQAVSTDSC